MLFLTGRFWQAASLDKKAGQVSPSGFFEWLAATGDRRLF
jgi:hypothetical protein